MRNPPGYGSIVDLGKNRRRPIAVRVPNGKKLNREGKEIIDYKYIGYFERTRQGKMEAQILLARYNECAPVKAVKTVNACPTFGEMSAVWLEKHLEHVEKKKGSVSKQLITSYRAAIKKCEPIHGKKMDRIRYQDVQDIADSVAHMSAASVTNIKIVLHETFDLARKQKYIEENFVGDIDFLHTKKEGKIHSSFSREEVSALWDNAGDKNVQIVLIMVYTGLRIEELLSMRNENVHMEERYMVGGVKTDAGKNRIIPIADKIEPFVRALYCPEEKFLLVRDGKRYSRTIFMENVWDVTMSKLGMSHLPHDTRYTCATMMDRAGINENSKKTILGHAKSGITNKVYVEKDVLDLLEAINMI